MINAHESGSNSPGAGTFSRDLTKTKSLQCRDFTWALHMDRDQARGRLGRNSRPRGRNFALNGNQGEVRVSLKKKKKFFFLGTLIFILFPHTCKLW